MASRIEIFSELQGSKKGNIATRAKNVGTRLSKMAKSKQSFQSANDKRDVEAVGRANIAKQAIAKASAGKLSDKAKRSAETRRATAAHKTKLARMAEIEDLRTSKQVDRVKAVGDARASAKPPAKATTKSTISKPAARPASKRPSNVGSDNLLKPAANPNKKGPKAPAVKLDQKAAEKYND